MVKDLQLILTDHPGNRYAGKRFFDFLLSGQSLRHYLGITNQSSVTPFGFFPVKAQQERALKEFRLQTKTELSDSRIELYVCEDCGDIYCGSVTARIIDQGDLIVWTRFATQSDPEELSGLIDVADLEFKREDYFKALSVIK